MTQLRTLVLTCLLLGFPAPALCQEAVPEIEPTPWYENNESVAYVDNTGALSSLKTDNTADIVNESAEIAAGALEGEIAVWRKEDKFVVYSNGNRVEDLIKGIGAIGLVTQSSSTEVRFKPTGKQDLICPSQSTADWFGPCKLETVTN